MCNCEKTLRNTCEQKIIKSGKIHRNTREQKNTREPKNEKQFPLERQKKVVTLDRKKNENEENTQKP